MKNDLTIFRYSTMLTLTRNGISTFAELETDSVLLEFLAKLPVDCLDAKGNVIIMYLNTDAVNDAWRKFSGGV